MKVSARANRFWKRLAQTYGARIADQYGPTCPPDWCKVIDSTDDDRLSKALMTIRQECLQYPPTLGQFEKAIPPKRRPGEDTIIDRLARYAMNRLPICRQQSRMTWNYFGRMTREGGEFVRQTRGVVIPACYDPECPSKSMRVTLEDLPE